MAFLVLEIILFWKITEVLIIFAIFFFFVLLLPSLINEWSRT